MIIQKTFLPPSELLLQTVSRINQTVCIQSSDHATGGVRRAVLSLSWAILNF